MRCLAGLGAPLALLAAGCVPYAVDMPRTPAVDPSVPVRADVAHVSPPAVAVAASDLPAPPPPPAAAPSPRRRPGGVAFGIAGGLGLAASRFPPATQTASSLGALASIWAGLPISDFLRIALRVDFALADGATRTDLVLDLAFFPGASRSGKVADFMIFADGGVRLPTTAVGAGPGDPQVGGAGRVGIGWESWRLGPVVLGPFVSGEIARGAGEGEAALVGGLMASLYPKGPARGPGAAK